MHNQSEQAKGLGTSILDQWVKTAIEQFIISASDPEHRGLKRTLASTVHNMLPSWSALPQTGWRVAQSTWGLGRYLTQKAISMVTAPMEETQRAQASDTTEDLSDHRNDQWVLALLVTIIDTLKTQYSTLSPEGRKTCIETLTNMALNAIQAQQSGRLTPQGIIAQVREYSHIVSQFNAWMAHPPEQTNHLLSRLIQCMLLGASTPEYNQILERILYRAQTLMADDTSIHLQHALTRAICDDPQAVKTFARPILKDLTGQKQTDIAHAIEPMLPQDKAHWAQTSAQYIKSLKGDEELILCMVDHLPAIVKLHQSNAWIDDGLDLAMAMLDQAPMAELVLERLKTLPEADATQTFIIKTLIPNAIKILQDRHSVVLLKKMAHASGITNRASAAADLIQHPPIHQAITTVMADDNLPKLAQIHVATILMADDAPISKTMTETLPSSALMGPEVTVSTKAQVVGRTTGTLLGSLQETGAITHLMACTTDLLQDPQAIAYMRIIHKLNIAQREQGLTADQINQLNGDKNLSLVALIHHISTNHGAMLAEQIDHISHTLAHLCCKNDAQQRAFAQHMQTLIKQTLGSTDSQPSLATDVCSGILSIIKESGEKPSTQAIVLNITRALQRYVQKPDRKTIQVMQEALTGLVQAMDAKKVATLMSMVLPQDPDQIAKKITALQQEVDRLPGKLIQLCAQIWLDLAPKHKNKGQVIGHTIGLILLGLVTLPAIIIVGLPAMIVVIHSGQRIKHALGLGKKSKAQGKKPTRTEPSPH